MHVAHAATVHNVIVVELLGFAYPRNTDQLGGRILSLLPKMTRATPRLRGEVRVFVGMGHGFFPSTAPFGFAFEYTDQSFSVTNSSTFGEFPYNCAGGLD